jgi:hypothetical protein
MINPFKKILWFFSHVFFFLSILCNIKLSIYTVRYKYNIKILSFLQNISKKFQKFSKQNPKTFKLIFF